MIEVCATGGNNFYLMNIDVNDELIFIALFRLTGTSISQPAKNMIMIMLQGDPTSRPNITQLMQHEFVTDGHCPASLPVSCLSMAPRFDKFDVSIRKPLSGINNGVLMRVTKKMIFNNFNF